MNERRGDSFLRAVGKALVARPVLSKENFINTPEVRVFYSRQSLLCKFQVVVAMTEKATTKPVLIKFRPCFPPEARV